MEHLFDVLAEPTRRQLLERLRRRGPLSISELASPLPISRQAVAKHLRRLEAAGLVEVERRGRQRLHRLDPEPLKEIEEWLRPYADAWDRRLGRLERHLKERS